MATPDQPQRVAVIGSPGAGKSWLSVRIGRKLGLPVHHLDLAFWQPGWVKTPHDDYVATQMRWIEGQRWVIDGNYTGTLHLRIPRADLIVWLDLPTWRCLWGISRRWWVDTERPNTPEGCPDQFNWEFLHYTAVFRLTRNPVIREKLEEFDGRLVHLRSRRAVLKFLEDLPPGPGGERHHTLSDGTPVTIRPITSVDRPLFERAIREVSEQTLRDRFHASSFRPTSSTLDYLTNVDQISHLAVGAATADPDGSDHGIGVARCIRRPGTNRAELAVTVIDAFQGRGVGSALVDALEELALTRGIEIFEAIVDAERRTLLRMLHRNGFHMVRCEDGIAELERRIEPNPTDRP